MSTLPIPTGPRSKLSPLVITLIAAGGVLLLVIVALLFLLIGRGQGEPNSAVIDRPSPVPTSTSASPTPVAEEPIAEEPVAEEDTTPRFTSFEAQTQVQCPNSGDKPEIMFSWETVYAVEVWYTSGHEDAKDDNYMQVPLAGSQDDLTDEHLFPCAHRQSEDYTVTLVGANGEHVSEYFTVTDLNW